MSYKIFSESPVGTVNTLPISIGALTFTKSSDHALVVVFAIKNNDSFIYTRLTSFLTEIKASCLYDSYSK